MFDFYERRKIKQFLYSLPVLILLGAVFILLTNGAFGVYEQERETRIIKNQRVSYLEDIEERESVLQEEIDRLNTDRGIEEEIRNKFEVARKGEGIIVIVNAPDNSKSRQVEDYESFFWRFFDFVLSLI